MMKLKDLKLNPVITEVFNKVDILEESQFSQIDALDLSDEVKNYMKISIKFANKLIYNTTVYGNSNFDEVFAEMTNEVKTINPNINIDELKKNLIDSLMEI